MADPAPTRRSSRSLPAPAASVESSSASPSGARRRSVDAAPARPAVVWGRTAADAVTKDAAVTVSTPIALPAAPPQIPDAADAPTQVSTRRARRASAPAPVTREESDVAVLALDAPVVPAAVPPEPEAAPAAAPTGRRVRTPAVPLETVLTPVEPFELLEPETVDDVEPEVFQAVIDPEPLPQTEREASAVDEFEAAARIFSFTGETPIMAEAKEEPAEVVETAAVPVHTAPRGRTAGRSAFKRMATASFSVGVMSIVGLLAVGMTTPAEAVAAASGTSTAATSLVAQSGGKAAAEAEQEIQAYVAPAQLENVALQRASNYETDTLVDLAGVAGIQNYSNSVFINNPNCDIQWPFAVGVTMSYGFGFRSGTLHEGIDFTPGEGAHVQAVADGVVRLSTDSGGAYGVSIVVDHVIDGQLVSSRYAHMQYGSRQVQVGDTVSVGQFLGQTGNTGRSFGAHLHFEILSGGATAIDPLPWLRAHTSC